MDSPPQFVVTVKFFGHIFTMHQVGYPSIDQIVNTIMTLPHWSCDGRIVDGWWVGETFVPEKMRLIAQDLSDWFSLDPVESEDLMKKISEKYLLPRRDLIIPGDIPPKREHNLVELFRLGGKLSDYVFIHHIERIDCYSREMMEGGGGAGARS